MPGQTDQQSEPIDVRDNPAAGQFEIWVGDERAGLTQYMPKDGALAFPHTEIDDAFGGRGLATTLIRAALDTVRESGGQVLPYCPFVRSFLRKHGDYLELVPAGRRRDFDLT